MARIFALRASRAVGVAYLVTACAAAAAPQPAGDSGSTTGLEEIQVTARRLNDARIGIQTQTGASTYTIDAAAIAAAPGGDNTLLNQVILQSPEVAQDSFGQFHIRGEHNGLQYRLNGIILPEGISVFGQSLDPRLISSMSIITGALPAEYGLRTGGVIDLTAKSGALETGGSVSLYGGTHGTFQPSFNYGGTSGPATYFVSGGMLRSDLGIESPDGRSDPIHDHTTQYHGFGYFEDILDENNRLSVIVASSVGKFEIPNRYGLQPSLGLTVNGATEYPSQALDENQREITHFAVLGWQHAVGDFNVQTSVVARYSSLTFVPDTLGDLLFTGIAQDAYKRNVAYALQSDASYKVNERHTVRGGIYLQTDRSQSDTTSQVLRTDQYGVPVNDVPVAITDTGTQTEWIQSAYIQDEWKPLPSLTVNYGLRLDHFNAYTAASQASPRLNMVWQSDSDLTLHAGYSRYLSPPPFELVGGKTVEKFTYTTSPPLSSYADVPLPERANYYDVGLQQKFTRALTLGVDTYYKQSQNLVDEGQFGAPIILTPFNYRYGKQYGAEFTANYTQGALTMYLNLAVQSAKGKDINTAQFNFSQPDLDYVARNFIHLDHEQQHTASGGASYLWRGTRLSADFLIGSGLRADLILPPGTTTPYGGAGIPNGQHLPYYTQANFGLTHTYAITDRTALTVRFDLINAFDSVYEIRDGTGIGVGAPQFGPRRGGFLGISLTL